MSPGFRNPSAIIWMLTSALLFAVMAAMASALSSDVSWPAIALVRSFFALVFAVLATMVARAQFVVWKPRSLWARSLAGTASLLCYFYAMTRLPLADAVSLFYMHPLWIALLSWVALGYTIRFQDMLAVAAGLIGVALIVQPHFASTGLATIVALGGSVFAAIAMLGLHRIRRVHTWAIVAHFSAVSTLAAIVCWKVVPEPSLLTGWHARSLLLLGGVGLCATLAQFCMTRAYAIGHPTWVSVAGLSQVVFAAAMDAIFWRRSFGFYGVLGMALIVGPCIWLITRPMDRPSHKADTAEVVEPIAITPPGD